MSFSTNPFRDLSRVLHSGEWFGGDAVCAGERAVEDGARGLKAPREAAKVMKNMSLSDIAHTALDVLGMVPVVGSPNADVMGSQEILPLSDETYS
jgi:hypothetical protein